MIGDELIDDLVEDEGWRDVPYHDHLGFLTLGYGFLVDPRRHIRMPERVGRLWLEILVAERLVALEKAWPPFADQEEEVKRALGNMAYQLGIRGVLNFKKMLDALERGDRNLARHEALDSKWAKQTPNRAKRVAALIGGE